MSTTVLVAQPDVPAVTPSRRVFAVIALAVGFLVGTALTVLAYHQARSSTSDEHFYIFWAGQLITLGTVLLVGTLMPLKHATRVCLLLLYAAFNFVPKFLLSTRHPTFFDEFGHWRQVQNIINTGNARPSNLYQPIIRDFPGLEWLTVGVHYVTRLSAWHSGQLVILAAHCAALGLVFGIARGIGLRDNLAFLAAIIYSLNPDFQYFDTQFAYESLGLTLALAAIYCAIRARRAMATRTAYGWAAGGVALAAACSITHHVSTVYLIVGTLLVAIFLPSSNELNPVRRANRVGAWIVPAGAVIALGLWVFLVAPTTYSYLEPHVGPGLRQLLQILHLRNRTKHTVHGIENVHAKHLFHNSIAPRWEQLAAYLIPFVALVLLVATLIELRRQRSRLLWRSTALGLILTLIYFASLSLTLTGQGSEAAHRSWAFTYLGVALVSACGVGVISRWLNNANWFGHKALVGTAVGIIAAVAVATCAVGGVSVGEDVYYRFPGPYLFGTQTRSITPEGVAMAKWANAHLPAGSHIITDQPTSQLIEGWTDLNVPGPNQSPVYELYNQGAHPNPSIDLFLRKHNFEYFILDRRILTTVPALSYFQNWSGYLTSVSPAALEGITADGFATPVYQSPNYVIYRIHP
jgi:hypothetical protein